MFGRMMNNYYYGKSGKGDYRKEDLPENRWQLFFETLRTRLSGLCRLNLLYMLIFIPAMVVIASGYFNLMSSLNIVAAAQQGDMSAIQAQAAESDQEITITEEEMAEIAAVDTTDMINSAVLSMLLWLVPCIAITGPFTAGLSYVTRNWARDEHAFIWSDFKDAVKANWKQSLAISAITSVLPLLIYVGWRYYGSAASNTPVMFIPQMLVLMIGIIWAISVTYMHPIIVTYDLKLKDVIRNGLLLGVARLPMSVGIRLLHCVPCVIAFLLAYLWHPVYGIMILGVWYIVIGFGLSRFITASYTNGVFDKYINSRIEGAEVNRGLRKPEDDDGDDDDTEAEETEG